MNQDLGAVMNAEGTRLAVGKFAVAVERPAVENIGSAEVGHFARRRLRLGR